MSKPWVERYRPATLNDVAAQDEVVRALSEVASSPQKAASLPHLLFYGPAGTGKTTTALALTRQLFGGDREVFSSRVKEMNASDDRGIQVIRDKVKRFAENAASGRGNLPPYKIIILDEADALLPDAQAALRRMMEDHAVSTRFILICNYVSRIIDPITSRCVKYRFRSLTRETVIQRLTMICEREGKAVPDEAFFNTLFEASGGDLRNAITMLQSVVQYSGTSVDSLTSASLCEVLNIVPEAELVLYIQGLFSGSFTTMQQVTTNLLRQGYAASRILHQIVPLVTKSEADGGVALSDVQRAALCLKIAEVEHRLMDGADDLVQLMDFGASVLAVQ